VAVIVDNLARARNALDSSSKSNEINKVCMFLMIQLNIKIINFLIAI